MLHFLLAPDSSSALRLRRLAASEKAWQDVLVGTWPDLLRIASASCIHQPVDDEWQAVLEDCIHSQETAFWAHSLRQSPSDAPSIIDLVGRQLEALLRSAGPDTDLEESMFEELSARSSRMLRDLRMLHRAMGGKLPADLARVMAVIRCPQDRVLRQVRVWYTPAFRLDPWQQALVQHLNQASEGFRVDAFQHLLKQLLPVSRAPRDSALCFMQQHLFTLPGDIAEPDRSLQWIGVRDYLQEVEVVAGMVQQAQRDDPSLELSEIALLLPDDQRYAYAVHTVFGYAGIPVSGLQADYLRRDLGGELLYNLLLALDKPSPVIVLASLLSSPLMPWDAAEGNRLAAEVVSLRFKLKPPEGSTKEAVAMLNIVREPLEGIEDLRNRLARFPDLLGGGEEMERQKKRAEELSQLLVSMLDNRTGEVPWEELLTQAQPVSRQHQSTTPPNREGVAVFSESAEPWRMVRRLFVLGCMEGHYPGRTENLLQLGDDEYALLRAHAGLALDSPEESNRRLRELFRRQLCSASEGVTFTVPFREPLGDPVPLSASLTFASVLFAGVDSPEGLVVNLESTGALKRVTGLPENRPAAASGRQLPEPADIHFRESLLDLVPPGADAPSPQTPSKLETLMVSPLAWFLERLRVEPREWAPEKLDIMTKGTLAHRVFEQLFGKDAPVPDAAAVKAGVPVLFDNAVREISPFLQRSEWKVEREHLRRDITVAAEEWALMLTAMGAVVLETEVPLQGFFEGIPVRGNADLILGLPGDRMAVVDYKKSSSSSRINRMRLGYDLQAELYRTMLETGGKADGERLDLAADIGTMYYCMNDQNLITDTDGWIEQVRGVSEMPGDSSESAVKLVRERLQELRCGLLRLNSESDEQMFEKDAGIRPYAFERTPLIRLFMKPAEEGGAI